MRHIGRSVSDWVRDRRADGVLEIFRRSSNRVATLAAHQNVVDDRVLSGLLNLSYLAEQRGDMAEMESWAGLAANASLLGGTSRGRVDVLLWQAFVQCGRAERASGTDEEESLDSATRAVEAALEVLLEVGRADDIMTAHHLRARIQLARHEPLAAFEAQLDSARVAPDVDDDKRAVDAISAAAELYWQLHSEAASAGAALLIPASDVLLHRLGSHPASAGLRTVLGDAYRRLDAESAAIDAWTTAREQYRAVGDRVGEFEVDGHLFEHAADRGDLDEALELGLRCLSAAPAGSPARRLGEHHHLLAATYHHLGQTDAAVAAFQRAIELEEQAPFPRVTPQYQLELALVRFAAGRYADAARDLEQVPENEVLAFNWLVASTLAEIHVHLGNMGAAVSFADSALTQVVSTVNSHAGSSLDCPTFRAHSLHRSGVAHLTAGDAETAYRRFADLMPLLAEELPVAVLDVSSTFTHPTMPPARSNSAWLAYLASERTERREEAAAYLRQYLAFVAAGESGFTFPAEFSDHFGEYAPMVEGMDSFTAGFALLRTDPQQAAARLSHARDLLAPTELPTLVLAQLDMAIGICRLRLGNHAEARAAFRSAMTGIADDPSSDVEYMCRTGLAEVALADGDLLNAEEQLACCIDLIEHSRASLSSVEGRVRFLNARLPQYETIVAVRLKLGRFTDAYDAARLTKSRTLTELLAEPEHRPIDYALEDDLAAVTLRWNDWISEHLRPPAQPDVEAELRMLLAQQEHSDRRRSIGDARRQRGLFDGLIAHEHPLAFVEVQALLFC